MKTVFFIRHAKSSWDDPGLKDIARPLNKRGLRDAPFMGKLLRGKGVAPDLIVSSPAERAFTTAGYFAEALGISADGIRVEETIYEASPGEVISVVQDLEDRIQTVLVFGHNPAFTSLANMFADRYIGNVPTCGIVHVESPVDRWADFNRDSGRMVEFYYPKQYFA